MGFKQPRVPEYQGGEGVERYIRTLVLFLKDFCQEAWTASRSAHKRIAGISYPVTSVNAKTGDVTLNAADVGARAADWTPSAADVGALESGATAADANKLGGRTWAALMLEIYPVGAVYISASEASPAGLFGGTWEQLKDRFLLAAGSSYTAGATGGAATVTLTASQMPAHDHAAKFYSASWTSDHANTTYDYVNAAAWGKYAAEGGVNFRTAGYSMTSAGGGGSHNNMPPYLAVYMWKRVS